MKAKISSDSFHPSKRVPPKAQAIFSR